MTIRYAAFLLLCMALWLLARPAHADTTPGLFSSFAGHANFTGTARSLRTQSDDGNACAITTAATSAALAGIPSGATVTAAYLYWAGSSTNLTSTPDYTVTFEGNTISAPASRRYTATFNYNGTNYYYFSGAADITSIVSAKGNDTYTLSGLTVNAGTPHCTNSAVVGGWAIVAIYSHPGEDFRVINVFEGFQAYRGNSITLTPNNFRIPPSPINGKHAYITWEGDVGNSESLNGFNEGLIFNGITLSDGSNPATNQFNSISTITSPPITTYGVDFDVFNLTSSHLTPGETSAQSIYRSGGDLVLLSAEIISVTNTAVADLSVSMSRPDPLDPGQNATYSIIVTNNGPNSEPGPITVVDTLPSGLSYVSASGSGWSCSAVGQTVTCTRTGSIASGASAPALVLTVAVAANASGTKTNTATVTGSAFDNISSNNTASDSYTMWADLSILMSRTPATLSAGGTASYTILVTNDGPGGQPAPITVTDTLPTGVTFASASGTGWSCSSSGQTVTCTRNSLLPRGTTAPALTLNVNIASTVSGAVINTATVSAAGGLDTNTANNTATDSYTFPPFAYYAMDETAWGTTGAVKDSSGNNRHGSRLGTAAPTGYPFAAGGAIPGTPGTCGAGSISAGTSQGVNTGIDINSVGNAGTIAFWYRSNSAWNDNNDRMLLDASADLGNNHNQDRHFYLVKRENGGLRFAIEDSSDLESTAVTTTNYSFAAGTWHHIAITWNLGADRLFIYVDGALAGSSTTNVGGTLGNMDTLYIGTRRSASVSVNVDDYTANSANGYIDEVYIYGSALSATGINALKNLTHPCTAAVHHYELSLPEKSISCMPTTVTVTACADSSSPCTNPFAGVEGQTATLSASGATLANETVAFDSSGTATTTLSYPAAPDATPVIVQLSGETLAATNLRRCCKDGTTCAAANSCTTTFSKAGFVFSTTATGKVNVIPPQISGLAAGNYYLRAIQTNTAATDDPAKACVAALTGRKTLQLAYQCNNPSTCYGSDLMQVAATTTAMLSRNGSSSVTAYTDVDMTFDANGSAPFSLRYDDVGQVTLWAKTEVNNSPISGSSGPFVVRPFRFDIAVPGNPGASGPNDPVFVRAGHDFSVTVTARNATGVVTPSFGRETPPEGVALEHTLVAPAGGLSGTLSGGIGSFSNGVASGSYSFSEVGIIRLAPKIAPDDADEKYLGSNVVGTTGTISLGTNLLTVASPAGIAVTDLLMVEGAGPEGGKLVATVNAINGTVITLSNPALAAVADAGVFSFSGNVGRFIPNHFSMTGRLVPRSDVRRTTGTIGAGATTLAVASSANIATGDYLMVWGAGQGGTGLAARVVGVAGNTITLNTPALTGATNTNVYHMQLTGSIGAGSNLLNIANGDDPSGIAVGDKLSIDGAGPGGEALQATVTAVAGQDVTLSVNADSEAKLARVAKVNAPDAFTYMAEPMLMQFAVMAHNTDGDITANYIGPYAKLDGASLGANWFTAGCASGQCFGLGAIGGSTPLTPRLSLGAMPGNPVSSWSGGVGTFAVSANLARPTTATADATWGPYDTLKIGAAPRDSDGVTLDASAVNLDADASGSAERQHLFTTRSRMGRLKVASAHGSELLPLTIGVTAQYWNGTGYVTNMLDNSSAFQAGNVVFSNPRKNFTENETSVSPPSVVFVNGKASYKLAKPSGDGKYDGSLDMNINVFNPHLPNPVPGRARFGVYKGHNEVIYLRENF
ncbi:DUF6701 domain-containing protein [Noviherbaspirillum sp.]|uniref:DUF6701 domain-containing protein n=1 Tax=Noviherbaspirillum sp. TaxID=1926288 RepID=UPI002D4B8E7D|nr:DUF6701 domain-containing protein [Noviherbaspirillum sp.]HZW21680.1 DUF6701 domain-containing protein [Noviherbaspirillum sp.]